MKKIRYLYSQVSMKGFQSKGEVTSPQRNIRHFKTQNFFNFYVFYVGHFCVPGSNPNSDACLMVNGVGTHINTTGYASE
jgi:hypothetical protein